MEILDYIIENRIILVPVLYVLGAIIKNTQFIKDKFIPVILLVIGVALSIAMGGDTLINNIIQGILVTGATVLGNQLVKQIQRSE